MLNQLMINMSYEGEAPDKPTFNTISSTALVLPDASVTVGYQITQGKFYILYSFLSYSDLVASPLEALTYWANAGFYEAQFLVTASTSGASMTQDGVYQNLNASPSAVVSGLLDGEANSITVRHSIREVASQTEMIVFSRIFRKE